MPPGTGLRLDKTSVLSDGKPIQHLVGSLLYISNTTRPDIAYAAGCFSRFMHHPTMGSWKCAKHVLRYLKESSGLRVKYTKGGVNTTLGYSKSDWKQNKHQRKSLGGYIFMFANGAISWLSRKQDVVVQSSVEAEYIALLLAIWEVLWIKKFSWPIGFNKEIFNICIKKENDGCISLSRITYSMTDRSSLTSNINLLLITLDAVVSVDYISTSDMLEDAFLKALPCDKFQHLVRLMGMK